MNKEFASRNNAVGIRWTPNGSAIIQLFFCARKLAFQSWSFASLGRHILFAFLVCLAFAAAATAQDAMAQEVDADHDGLIEIHSLSDLNNIRYDLAGASYKTSADDTGDTSGCPELADPIDPDGTPDSGDEIAHQCHGYELMADLDFDTDGNGRTDVEGDDYWNGGRGWAPIGAFSSQFTATFDGNGHTIANLFIDRGFTDYVGLFGFAQNQEIRNLRLVNATVTGQAAVGSLAGSAGSSGTSGGSIVASYAEGTVVGTDGIGIGGLVGIQRDGVIVASSAVVTVSGFTEVGGLVGFHVGTLGGDIIESSAEATVSGRGSVGGLVGSFLSSLSTISKSYAVATVSSDGDRIGGLVGESIGFIAESYALATVSGGSSVGGLVGELHQGGRIAANYAIATVSGSDFVFTVSEDVGGLVGTLSGRSTANYAVAIVSGVRNVGGLAGALSAGGRIAASYAVAVVSGRSRVGGLAGQLSLVGTIAASYAMSTVSGVSNVGGLAAASGGTIIASYFDADIAGLTTPDSQSRTTRDLQLPTSFDDGIYMTWDAEDLNDANSAGELWQLGTEMQYPGLVLPASAAGSCAAVASANIMIEATTDGCIHRPASSPIIGFNLLEADDSGQSSTDRITNKINPRVTGQTALLQDSTVRIVSRPTLEEVSSIAADANGDFTASVRLSEGLNVFEAFARRPGDMEDTALLGLLEITLDTKAPNLFVNRSRDGLRVSAYMEDAHPGTIEYGELTGGTDCTMDFDADALYAGVFPAAADAEYCLVATDLAGNKAARATAGVPVFVDADGNGLIEIDTLADLNNIRHNLAGTSSKTSADAIGNTSGCPTIYAPYDLDNNITACYGYELMADLDFDTDENGRTDVAGDDYWNGGRGWAPLGTNSFRFDAHFDGNGHTISNLFIDRSLTDYIGLFGRTDATFGGGEIRNLGVLDANVTGLESVGGLVGWSDGAITASYAQSTVSGTHWIGGLAGILNGDVTASYAASAVSGVSGVGGLVGFFNGDITASYAASVVSGASSVGGLAGWSRGAVTASYAVSAASGASDVGGLVGNNRDGSIADSYFDAILGLTQTDNLGRVNAAYGKASDELQMQIGDEGIYANWDVDVTGDGNPDAPWHFGDATQYPGLILRPAAGACPVAASADVLIESIAGQCVHRPSPLLVGGLGLVAEDDSGRSDMDRITDRPMARLRGRVTLPKGRVIRIDSARDGTTIYEVEISASGTPSHIFTTEAVALVEGSNRFAVFARRSGDAEYADPPSELKIVLDTLPPSLTLFQTDTTDPASLREAFAKVSDGASDGASDLNALHVAYGEIGGADACDADFDASTDYPLMEPPLPPLRIEVRTEYCFVAADAAGNKAAASTAEALALADADGNGLMEIDSLEDLNNVRHNLEGTSFKTSEGAAGNTRGCPTTEVPYNPDGIPDSGDEIFACYGYELAADLDFDTDGNARTDVAGDDYWNGGRGWLPIGLDTLSRFDAVFEGNGHAISNLFIDRRSEDDVGLFGVLGNGEIRNLRVIDAHVAGRERVGGVAGFSYNDGTITASFAAATVSGIDEVGGLVGWSIGEIAASSAVATVSGRNSIGGLVGLNSLEGSIAASSALATVSGNDHIGGLVGWNAGNSTITASFAAATVSGIDEVGGLVGLNSNEGTIAASYAAATVSGNIRVGGLVGFNAPRANIDASYFDADIAGSSPIPVEFGEITRDLQRPTTYIGIYSTWDDSDLDDDGVADAPWNFGDDMQYPGLALAPLAGGACPATASANIMVETAGEHCIHRPASLRLTEFRLLADDDSGRSNADRITNITNPRITGKADLPLGSAIRIVSRPTLSEVSTTTVDDDGSFTLRVKLTEGLNVFEAFARRAGDAEHIGRLGALGITLDTVPPNLLVERRIGDGFRWRASVEDAHPDTIEYGAVLNRRNCTPDFAAEEPYAAPFLPEANTDYCFVATDLAGNKAARSTVDTSGFVDVDGNGLIEIDSLADLDNIRHNLAGTSSRTSANAADNTAGCPAIGDSYDPDNDPTTDNDITACYGYELTADLDFDANGDSTVTATDSGGAYYNSGQGWAPIGTNMKPFAAVFDGNNRTIANLFIDRSDADSVGLFGHAGNDARIRQVGLVNANVTGSGQVGSLAGFSGADITASYALATTVSGHNNHTGGLVGHNGSGGNIAASYALAAVAGTERVGGLVGTNDLRGNIAASYALATVKGSSGVGGLVGVNEGNITATYAVATVSGASVVGGLIGFAQGGAIAASYFDADIAALMPDPQSRSQSKTTRELQTPTTYGDIYATWDDKDLDGDGAADAPWNFGDDMQYPALLLPPAAGACPNSASADVLIEPTPAGCIHRPIPLQIRSFGLVAADDSGRSSTDRITNQAAVRLTGLVTSPNDRDIRIVEAFDRRVVAEIIYDRTAAPTNVFTTEAVALTEGFNRFEVSAKRSGAAEYAGAPRELEIVLDTTTPSLTLFRTDTANAAAPRKAFARVSDGASDGASDSSMLSVAYGEIGDADDCDANFDAPTDYPLMEPPLRIEVGVGTEYCFVATDVAGNKAATSTAEASVSANADGDGNGLIEIDTLADLDNVRHNLAGTSYKSSATAIGNARGCPTQDKPHPGPDNEMDTDDDIKACYGYELAADLDFDTDGNARTDVAGDRYWNDGAGWAPLGRNFDGSRFAATFEGNGYTIANLFINRLNAAEKDNVGLFGYVRGARIGNLGLINAKVAGNNRVGSLIGNVSGSTVTASFAEATVSGSGESVGGLVGWSDGSIAASYAVATVSGTQRVGGLVGYNIIDGLAGELKGRVRESYAVATVSGNNSVGGLVGFNLGSVAASYAAATVSGEIGVGGLAGANGELSDIVASYALATVSGTQRVGGVIGFLSRSVKPLITASYFNADIAGLMPDPQSMPQSSSQSRTTDELQTPIAYGDTGIYSTWDDTDLDGDGTADAPWNFGDDMQYPGLVLAPLAGGACPATASANIMVETMGEHCIHRPASLRLTEFRLLAADDSGSTNTDSITKVPNPRITGKITLPQGNAIRIVSRPTLSELSTTTVNADGRFTLRVNLAEGLNVFEALARRPGDAEHIGLLGALEITLDTVPPNLLVERTGDGLRWRASVEDAHPGTIEYDALPGAADDCTTELAAGRPYAAPFLPDANTEYCFVATDLAGNKAARSTAVPADADGNGLIEIDSLEDLDNVRHNLAGTSYKSSATATENTRGCPMMDAPYDPDRIPDSGDEIFACYGYELVADLDFDTDGNARTDVAGDDYWNGGRGWAPIGTGSSPFAAVFEGNGHTIANLFVSRSAADAVGLFGRTGDKAQIRHVGLVDANVTGGSQVGSLVGVSRSTIMESYATASTVAGTDEVGGLVGLNDGIVIASYAAAAVSGRDGVGGLVGASASDAAYLANYAIATVEGNVRIGGLVGFVPADFAGMLRASYAVATVSGNAEVYGLARAAPSVAYSYFDAILGLSDYADGSQHGRSSDELQLPIDYAEIYANWDVDVTGDGNSDAPWHFGDDTQYPGLILPPAAGACPNSASADILIEPTPDNSRCIHRPIPLLVGGLGLVAADDSGRSSTDRITNRAAVRLTGQVTLPNDRDIRIVAAPDRRVVAEIIYDQTAASTNVFTTEAVALAEGSNRFEAFARRSGEAEYAGSPSELEVVLDRTTPSLTLFQADTTDPASPRKVFARASDGASDSSAVSVAYGEVGGADNCDTGFDAPTDYPLMEPPLPPLRIEVGAGVEYCFVATDVAGNKAAASTAEASVLADADGNGLIEIDSLEDLDNVRHNLVGTSYKSSATAIGNTLGCPTMDAPHDPDSIPRSGDEIFACYGYELVADLDFDTDGNARTDVAGDDYWNDGRGWAPIGAGSSLFAAVFDGNGHTIANLFISRSAVNVVGLFGQTGDKAQIRSVGLVDANVTGGSQVGSLVGVSNSTITASYATASTVSGTDQVGGLVGLGNEIVISSYAVATVRGRDGVGGLIGVNHDTVAASYAAAAVSGRNDVGGLVGESAADAAYLANYAIATVEGNVRIGGLIGFLPAGFFLPGSPGQNVLLRASYAVATVSGNAEVYGLAQAAPAVANSYFDAILGIDDYADGSQHGRSSYELQAPDSTAPIYATWDDADLDGDGMTMDEWDFGDDTQYPGLILPPPAGACPNSDSADILIEPTPDNSRCIHRPIPLLVGRLGLVAGDDSGRSSADRITNQAAVRLTGLVTLPKERVIRIDSARVGTIYEVEISDSGTPSHSFTTAPVALAEGSNRFEVFARRSGEAEYAGSPSELEVVLDRTTPSLTLFQTDTTDPASPRKVFARASDGASDGASDSSVVSVAYGEIGDADNCDTGFDAPTDYPLMEPPLRIEVGAGVEYCFVATDVAGNKAAASTAEALILADANGNGLIEIDSLADLDNVRHNLAGTSFKTSADAIGNTNGCPTMDAPYDPDRIPDSGDEIFACYGYELVADLDFDTDGNARTDVAGDDYWNGGEGWAPLVLGSSEPPLEATFEGNGHTIANLFIDRISPNRQSIGLFEFVRGEIRNLGLVNADVRGHGAVGSLVGFLAPSSTITRSYAIATVSGEPSVGGLVGGLSGAITESYAIATVSNLFLGVGGSGGLVGVSTGSGTIATSYAVAMVQSHLSDAGGLVGAMFGRVTASYAVATVSGPFNVGGLAGETFGRVTASYAVATVSAPFPSNVGGLVGDDREIDSIASYFDADVAGLPPDSQGRTTDELQLPIAYGDTGIYSTWDDSDLDGDGIADAPWNFGSDAQYPGLVLAPLASGACPASASANIMVETIGEHCIHRPASLRISEFKLLEEDDSGRSNTDRITNNRNPRVVGQTTLPEGSTVRIVSRPTLAEVSTTTVAPDGSFIVRVNLAEGLNVLEAFARRPGDAEHIGLLGALGITLDTVPPSLSVYRIRDGLLVNAEVEDAHPDILAYGVLADGEDCTIAFPANRRYSGAFSAVAGTDYCLVATDLADNKVARSTAGTPIFSDVDGDGLIDINTLKGLDNIRHNLAGTSYKSSATAIGNTDGCPTQDSPYDPDDDPSTDNDITECYGYELAVALDFDGNGNNRADAGDGYWNNGEGWQPIGTSASSFSGVFEGNGHTISNLFISRSAEDYVGLFGSADGAIRNLGLVDANITGRESVGSLAGRSLGSITESYAVATVSGADFVGGLVGHQRSGVIASSYAVAAVSADGFVGGLVGLQISGAVTSSYAAATVSGADDVGGLAGWASGDIEASYALATVSGAKRIGGLVGSSFGAATASYFDNAISGIMQDSYGRNTAELQTPTSNTRIYADWSAAWDFGSNTQYPGLALPQPAAGSCPEDASANVIIETAAGGCVHRPASLFIRGFGLHEDDDTGRFNTDRITSKINPRIIGRTALPEDSLVRIYSRPGLNGVATIDTDAQGAFTTADPLEGTIELTEGLNTFEAFATRAGETERIGMLGILEIILDTQAPSLVVSRTQDGLSVSASMEDAHPDTIEYGALPSGEECTTDFAAVTTYIDAFSADAAAEYCVIATDLAGNKAAVSTADAPDSMVPPKAALRLRLRVFLESALP